MSMVHTGVTAIVTGNSNINVLAHLIGSIDYDTLKIATRGKLTVTEDEFEQFITEVGQPMIDVGLLDAELMPTGTFNARLTN